MILTRRDIQRMISSSQGESTTIIEGQSGGGGTASVSIGMSVPQGFSVNGSPVGAVGTLTIGYASGYALPTTADVEKGVTAYGWGDHAAAGYLTQSDISDMATETWVQQQGFLTSSAISDMATETWVQQQGYLTPSAISDMATETWVQQQGYLTSYDMSNYALQSWVNSNFVGKDATTGRLTNSLVFSDFDYGIEFYDGNTYGGRLGLSQVGSSYQLTFGDGQNAKRVLLAGDADKNIPLYDKNGNWSGGITSMNGLYGYFHYVNAGVYKLDYLPNGDVGVQNGKVLRLVELPGFDVIKANSNYNQDYNRIDGNIDPDDTSDEAYFKGLVRWAITEYLGVYKSDNSNITLIGSARPNYTGTVHIDLYGGSGRNPNADDPTLPMYCSGMYLSLSGVICIFRTYAGAWYWRQINPASIDAASLGGMAAANYATQSWVNSQGNAASATRVVQGNNDRLVTNANGVTAVGDNNNSTIGFRTDGSAHYEPYIMVRKTLDGNSIAEFHLDYYTANGGHHFKDATSSYADVYAKSFVANGSSNDYVLLGGGGTKAVTDFATWMDRPVTARGLNVAGDSTLAAPHVRMTYDYVSGGRFSMNFKGYAGDSLMAPISYIFDAPVTQSSDIRMKDVTDYLEPSVYDMAQAPIVKFRWKNEAEGAEHVGTVAQYWQQVVPELVGETPDGMLTMDYATAGVVAGVTAARKIVELERRVKVLENIIRHGVPASETEDENI